MEKISTSYVKTICNYHGYPTSVPESDYGIDLQISQIEKRISTKGGIRYFETNRKLGIQMKATHEASTLIKFHKNYLTYSLKSKNYNDLVITKDYENGILLILFVLPNDKKDWINLTPSQLEVRKRAYWFKVAEDATESNNKETVSINIPLDQTFSGNTIDWLFKEQYGL